MDSSKPGFTTNSLENNRKNNTLQIYHEKVKIIGNVVINSILLDSFTTVIVNNQPFQMSMIRNYWLNNEFQVIPVHVTFQKGASVPHLITSNLNGVNIEDYMVQNLENKKPAHFYFENITIFGDIFFNPEKQHWPNLQAISDNSVRYFGR